MKVYVVNGAAMSGKDTFCDMVCKLTGGRKYSTIDTFKEIARESFNWNGIKDEKSRKFLSDFKRIANEFNDFTINEVRNEINSWNQYYGHYVNPDIIPLFIMSREPKEIARICKEFNAKSVFIVRDSVEPIQSNDSDKYVKDFTYDICIDNSGNFENLANQAFDFIKSEGLYQMRTAVKINLLGEVEVE